MLVSFAREVGAPALAGKWTTTDPPINFVHIELGEINRRGEVVGYHHRPDGVDPPEARVVRVVQPRCSRAASAMRFSIAIAPDGAAIRNAVLEGAIPERYTLGELRAALETWIAAIERARRNPG
jgi:hypothetical protein